MKRVALLFLLVLGALGLAQGVALAADGPTLALTDIAFDRNVINPGDTVAVVLSYRVEGDLGQEAAAIPFTYAITLRDADSGEQIGNPIIGEGAVPAPPVAGVTYLARETFVAPKEGDYTVEAVLATAVQSLDAPPEAAPNARQEMFTVQSILPPNIVNVLAGLGLFAAVMAIVAAGAEVVIDSLRVALGLKSKVTAMDAFNRLARQLPGQLRDLGVSADDLQTLQAQMADLRGMLNRVTTVADVRRQLAQGQFSAAFDNVLGGWDVLNRRVPAVELITAVQATFEPRLPPAMQPQVTAWIAAQQAQWQTVQVGTAVDAVLDYLEQHHGQELGQALLNDLQTQAQTLADLALQKAALRLREQLKQALRPLVTGLLRRLSLPESYVSGFANLLEQQINQVRLDELNSSGLLEMLAHFFSAEGPQVGIEWLGRQANLLVGKNKAAILQAYDAQVGPALREFGLDTAVMRTEMDKTLGLLEQKSQAAIDAYVVSLKNLMIAVEARRNATQSPFRKAWRTLRNAAFPFWLALLSALLGWAVWRFVMFDIIPGPNLLFAFLRLFVAGLVASGAGLLLQALFFALFDKHVLQPLGQNQQTLLGLMNRGAVAAPAQPPLQAVMALRRAETVHARDLREIVEREAIRPLQVYVTAVYARIHQDSAKLGTQFQDLGARAQRFLLALAFFSVGDLLFAIETAWNFALRRPNEQGRLADAIQARIEQLSPERIAAFLQERDDEHRDEEASRLRWLRALAAFVGFILAFLLQIDAVELLSSVVPDAARINAAFSVTLPQLWAALPLGRLRFPWPELQNVITPGVILTGLAASAGSAYWHDVLDRLQAAKKGTEAATKLLQQAKSSLDADR